MAVSLTLLLAVGAWIVWGVLPFSILRPSRAERWTVYPGRTPEALGLRAEEFWTEAAPGLWLKGWFVHPRAFTATRGTVVLLHGSSSCKESLLGPAAQLADHGYNAILYDSRAHGESGGKFATYGFYEKEDFSRVLDEAGRRFGDLGPTMVFGSSYGAAVALQAMARDPRVCCGVLECPFADLRETIRHHGWLWLRLPAWVSDLSLNRAGQLARFDPDAVRPERDAARLAGRPVLLIHGTADPRIPIACGERIFRAAQAAAPGSEWYPVPGAGHEDLWRAGGAEYQRRVTDFYGRHAHGGVGAHCAKVTAASPARSFTRRPMSSLPPSSSPSSVGPPPPLPPDAILPDDMTEAPPVVGMIHVGALPGTPASRQSVAELVDQARYEARLLADAGVNCIGIENMHDTPYLRATVGPEIVATMTMVAQAVRAESRLPTGIQILAGANREALAVALAAELEFVRVEGFSFAHIADEGLIDSCAAELLRYRRTIGAAGVHIWADIKKKHASHALTADISLGEAAAAAEFMRADAVIVTGSATGHAPEPAAVQSARDASKLPVFVGSGVTLENVSRFLPVCDGLIVGSHFKANGVWTNAVDPDRVNRFMDRVRDLLAQEQHKLVVR